MLATTLFVPLVASAAGMFPDVGDNHSFKAEIESLARAGVVKGNPDGNFYPDRNVNRAEFLKLLYTASKRQPKAIYAGCFTDVERGSWYEPYVCDAAAKENGFVQGYSDGKFRPGSPVSRTEALKMTFTVFGLPLPDISVDDKNVIKFVDISVSAWYSKYISAAYKFAILPIAGQAGARFYPDKELLRGEAAAYIFNAQRVSENGVFSSSSSSESSTGTARSSSSSKSAEADVMKYVAFPFNDSGQFIRRKTVTYSFELKDPRTVVNIKVGSTGFYQSDITCRLYLMGPDGFSAEYYLGVQSQNMCTINVAVRPGKYQLQLQPSVPDAAYTVDAKIGTSDGNDGFVDALPLTADNPRTATLDSGDLTDWYTFTIGTQKQATIDVTSGDMVTCVIYTPLDVDQFGFTGPQCSVPYNYVEGQTYTVGISRANTDVNKKITYTVRWR